MILFNWIQGDIMKKIIALMCVGLLAVSITACKNDPQPTEVPNETEVHTLPPTENISDDYEWAEIDCYMTISDADNNVIVNPEDFTTFAVVGSTDEDSYIIVKVTEQATEALNNVADKSQLFLLIGGDSFGDVSYGEGEFTGEIELGHSLPYDQVCNLATTIRGLFN